MGIYLNPKITTFTKRYTMQHHMEDKNKTCILKLTDKLAIITIY